jgi:NAD(P)-dependent dehydrogenase (short-subunit alcohol dehydrogenase family)
MKPTGKKALITGGNSGIGLAIARLFVAEGAQVAITGRDQKTLDEAIAELGSSARGYRADVTIAEDRKRLFAGLAKDFGKLDIVFANGGISGRTPTGSTDEAIFENVIHTNLTAAFFTVNSAVPLLNDNASIIFSGSVHNYLGQPGVAAYAATKGGLVSMARSIATDLAPRNIRVNVVAPGAIKTPIWKRGPRASASEEDSAKLAKFFSSAVPQGRWGEPEEVAKAVLFLASDDSSYVNAIELMVDGGATGAPFGAPIIYAARVGKGSRGRKPALKRSSGIGGEMVTENIEGRERYPVDVRYSRDFRNNVEDLRRVLIATPSGAQIPIKQVARISFSRGPAMIRDEDGALTGCVYIDLNSKDYGGFVKAANDLFRQKLQLQPGHTYKWAGEYEFEQRAKERLKIILPVVFFVIFVLLYMVFHSVAESAVLIFPTIYALTGGLILQKLLGYNFSVAVWVGYIALFGIAVETGVVMVVYLHEALGRRLASGKPLKHEDIEEAVIEGAVHRLRPKLMTVCVVLASLIPILWESGVGSDVMKPIAAPIVGGMITSTIHVLILVPVFFALMKERALGRGTLHLQGNDSAND